ncbi:MAG: glycosyltransferase family 2 protein [Chloroflexi bacterium]|nr:glycosyltransferase family 2 protein [Chloroflexota bacterium]
MQRGTPGITAIVIAHNEERHIRACLETLAWADARLVLDAFSADRTPELAAGLAIVHQRPFDTFARQRNAALDLAATEWAFFLDADERCPPELGAEIRARVSEAARTAGGPAGFWVPRRNYILGRWVRHAGWWPDEQLRVLRRGRARYDEDRDPHEVVTLQGAAGHLTQPIIHFNYASVGQLFAKQHAYAQREARALRATGLPRKPRWLLTQPLREFHRRYVQWQGYREGLLGLFLCLLMAWYRFQVERYARTSRP